MKLYRVLVTGSRHWTDRAVIRDALWAALTGPLEGCPDSVLIQGECEYGGADAIAKEFWKGWELPVESYPAERKGNRILGPERNAKMVKSGADLCLAFPLPGSRGTVNCMRLAMEAGIPVHAFQPGEKVTWI